MYRPIFHATAHISHHVAALAFFKGAEFGGHLFFDRFGYDIRTWPIAVLTTLGVVVYLTGLATARAIDKHWIRRTKTRPPDPPIPVQTADVVQAAPIRPTASAEAAQVANWPKEPSTLVVAMAASAALLVLLVIRR